MSKSGAFVGGRELTRTEARALGIPTPMDGEQNLPNVQPPRWDTKYLHTRESLLALFTREWGESITADDVQSYVRHLRVTDYIPFPPMGEIPPSDDPRAEHRDRMRAITDYENGRAVSQRARELYDINGVPVFVPQDAQPSQNDSPAENRRRAEKIANLNPKDD